MRYSVLFEIDDLIASGAKTIPTKLVKKLLKEMDRDADAHQNFLDKLEETIQRYG